jgi:hypothetical protein
MKMVYNFPVWLPPIVSVSPWSQDTFDMLYKIFEVDFKNKPLSYNGYTVWFFSEMLEGKELIFWHLTHREDKETNAYYPDLRRSERLPWARPVIENSTTSDILAWDFKEHDGKIMTYVWLKEFDYLILMKKYKDGQRRLVTSYCIDYEHKKRTLEKKYKCKISE